MLFIDLTGRRFGRLLVEKPGDSEKRFKGTQPKRFWCICDCGTRKLITGSNLRRGISTSCGCYAKEQSSKRQVALAADPNEAIKLAFIRGCKGNARNRDRTFDLSKVEAINLAMSDCHYCGAPPSRLINLYARTKSPQGTLKLNGIDRIDNCLGYVSGNCVAACTVCNQAKHTLTLEQWNAWLDRIIKFRAAA